MSTTSVKLPDDLKARVAWAAESRGESSHAFLVTAIRQATDAAERHASFMSDAARARAHAVESGRGYAAEDVHAYVHQKVRNENVTRPKPRPWRE